MYSNTSYHVRGRCTLQPSIKVPKSTARFASRSLTTHLRAELIDIKVESTGQTTVSIHDSLQEGPSPIILEDDLSKLVAVLPVDLRDTLLNHPNRNNLLEIVLDLGRRPEARFLGKNGGEFLRASTVSSLELEYSEAAVGDFMRDNRAGIEGTLHRISAMRNRKGTIVGLTCRVGRAVTGHVDLMRDLLDEPNSILFLGRPGVGKTTMIRELARVLADVHHKRVVIIDTSNELGGDGDIPHPAIGGARRMQVPDVHLQHQIMIEAVENHMPEVIIVDEIGNEAEALACRTIAERGVMLIGTAHGNQLHNVIQNPSLSDLIGGIQSVTLGDEEARSRGTQKSVLERRAPPTFPLVIEMREREAWVAHWVEDSVDALLNGRVPMVQVRKRDGAGGKVMVLQEKYDAVDHLIGSTSSSSSSSSNPVSSHAAAAGASAAPVPSRNSAKLLAQMQGMDAMNNDDFMNNEEWGGQGAPVPMEMLNAGGGGGSAATEANAWAQKLKNMSDREVLQEMATLGYLGGVEGGAVGGGALSMRKGGLPGLYGSEGGQDRRKRGKANAKRR